MKISVLTALIVVQSHYFISSVLILCVVVARSDAVRDPQSANSKGTASIVLSVIGIAIGIICTIIVIVLWAVGIVVVTAVSDSLT